MQHYGNCFDISWKIESVMVGMIIELFSFRSNFGAIGRARLARWLVVSSGSGRRLAAARGWRSRWATDSRLVLVDEPQTSLAVLCWLPGGVTLPILPLEKVGGLALWPESFADHLVDFPLHLLVLVGFISRVGGKTRVSPLALALASPGRSPSGGSQIRSHYWKLLLLLLLLF